MCGNADQLLQEIYQAVSCPYLSDLRTAPFDERAKVIISEIPDSSYSVAAWNEAIAYITGAASQCQSIRGAKEMLHQK